MRQGIVRPSAASEHPTLGLLTPGSVIDIPDDLWSDDLFLPSPKDGIVERIDIGDADLPDGIVAELQAARDMLPRVAAMHAAAQQSLALSRRLADQVEHIRPLLRRLQGLKAALEEYVQSGEIQVTEYNQQIAALTGAIEQIVEESIRPALAEVQATLSANQPTHPETSPAPTESSKQPLKRRAEKSA